MGDDKWEIWVDDGRQLKALVQHPGWTIFVRELEGQVDRLYTLMRAEQDIHKLAMLTKEYMTLKGIKTKPEELVRVIDQEVERHNRRK